MKVKIIFINLFSSYIHIILSALMNIMYVPISVSYLGIEKYGVWIVLQTIVNFLTMANFGIPTAVTNLMCQIDANDKVEKLSVLKKGNKILIFICLILLLVLLFSYLFVKNVTNWIDDFNNEVIISCIVLFSFFILRIPFQVSSAAFISDNKIYLSKIYEFLTTAITFLSLVITVFFKQNLIFLSILSGVLLLALNVISYFNAMKILEDKISLHPVSEIKAKTIYKPGFLLFVSGLGSIIVWNTDNIVISNYLGLEEVAKYSTALRLFSFAYMSFGLIYGIIVPYYGKFFIQKNWVRLQHLFNFNIMIIPFIAMCVWLFGWLFSREIIYLWLNNYKLYGGSSLYFILGAYGLVLAYVGVMNNFLTTLSLLKGLVYITVFEALINLILSITLAQYVGFEGVALGTLFGSIVGPLFFLPFLIDKNKKIELNFPYTKFLSSLFFYSALLSLLFFMDVVNYSFFQRTLIALIYVFLSLLFQFYLNKKTLKYILDLYKS